MKLSKKNIKEYFNEYASKQNKDEDELDFSAIFLGKLYFNLILVEDQFKLVINNRYSVLTDNITEDSVFIEITDAEAYKLLKYNTIPYDVMLKLKEQEALFHKACMNDLTPEDNQKFGELNKYLSKYLPEVVQETCRLQERQKILEKIQGILLSNAKKEN